MARLEKILASHDESTRGPKCEGMEGPTEEGEEMIEEDAEEEVRDAGANCCGAACRASTRDGRLRLRSGHTPSYWRIVMVRSYFSLPCTEESDTDKKLTKLANSRDQRRG